MKTTLDFALEYSDLGFSCIPFGFKGKYPLLEWKMYQYSPLGKKQLVKLFNRHNGRCWTNQR
jgi:hypothetical protein